METKTEPDGYLLFEYMDGEVRKYEFKNIRGWKPDNLFPGCVKITGLDGVITCVPLANIREWILVTNSPDVVRAMQEGG